MVPALKDIQSEKDKNTERMEKTDTVYKQRDCVGEAGRGRGLSKIKYTSFFSSFNLCGSAQSGQWMHGSNLEESVWDWEKWTNGLLRLAL